MAKRLAIPSKESQLVIVGPNNFFKASRIQRASLTAEQPSTDVDELGSSSHAGQSKDSQSVTLTFSAFDVGVKVFSALTGTDWDAYPSDGVDISKLSEMDGIIQVKDATVADYVKSIHARKMQIRDFTFSYSVDGESTEDYTAIGSERRYFAHDVIVDRFTSGTTSFTLTQTPIQLKNGRYAISVILDGGYLTEVTGAPSTNQYRIVGTTLTTNESRTSTVLVVYHADPAGNNWADVSDSLLPAAIKGRDVKITIAANEIPRVQSVTINGTLNSQEVKEMNNRGTAGSQKQVPTIEGSITVVDTDNELISLFTTGALASGVEWIPGEGCTDNTIALSIQLQDPCDDTAPYTVLKEIYLDSITPTGDVYNLNVNQNATLQINFKSTTGHVVVYSGAKPA